MFNGLHYNSISTSLRESFGCRVVKLALDNGLTCPNRDGSKGTGGCSFCSAGGSGDFAGSIDEQIARLSRKWTAAEGKDAEIKYIAYFQSFSGTYAPAEKLRAMWDDAISKDGVVGLAVATRPDCLPPDVLELLDEYNKKTFLWVELGLQTARDETAESFNRCWKTEEFAKAMESLSELGIRCVVHLILGLPGETRDDMLASAQYAASFKPFGIKLHMLHLMKGTRMGEDYLKAPFPILSMQQYIETVCDILEHMTQDITVHRLTGDAPQDKLIAPDWTRNKHAVLNGIQKEFARRGTYQGYKAQNSFDL